MKNFGTLTVRRRYKILTALNIQAKDIGADVCYLMIGLMQTDLG